MVEEQRRVDLLGAMNVELRNALEIWKASPDCEGYRVNLNTLFGLAQKTGLDTTLEVDEEAITKRDDGFFRILPEEAAIYGGERGDLRVYNIPPTLVDPGIDPCVLCASSAIGEPALVYYHIKRGEIGRFRPSDVVSITLH